ncbi:MAG: hypothetical protein ACRCZO_07325, partial [Cetobacterium sp.]
RVIKRIHIGGSSASQFIWFISKMFTEFGLKPHETFFYGGKGFSEMSRSNSGLNCLSILFLVAYDEFVMIISLSIKQR